MKTRLTWILTAVLLLSVPAGAQDRQPMQINSYGAVLDNIDLLIDHYANFLARKYELTDEQDQYTRHMLRERSHEFLDTHEDQLRGLIETLFEVRTGGEMTAEGLIEWGQSAEPIYEDARKLIISGNEDWREILSEEQKAKHDEDLKLMYESFETTETQLDRIMSGDMDVEEFRNPRRARSVRRSTARATNEDTPPPPPDYREPPSNRMDQPSDEATAAARERAKALRERLAERRLERAQERAARDEKLDAGRSEEEMKPPPPTPPAGKLTEEEAPATPTPRRTSRRSAEREDTKKPEETSRERTPRRSSSRTTKSGKDHASAWERYVEDFIQRYELDDAQQQKARSILEDCKQTADRYLASKKSKMDQIDAELAKLKADRSKENSKRRSAQVTKYTEQQQKLREPIDDIFEKQLKPRLERIPRRSQRKAAEESKTKKKSSSKRGKD